MMPCSSYAGIASSKASAPSVSEEHASVINSIYLAGNIDFGSEDDEPTFDTFESVSFNHGEEVAQCEIMDHKDLTMEEVQRTNSLIEVFHGQRNVMSCIVRAINTGLIDCSDISLQSFLYKVQSVTRGKKSVRYHDSYGMFWAGVRNIIKSSGLVVFKEHYPVPTNLNTYKKKIVNLCGIDPSSLGSSGLLKRNIEIWLERKFQESKCKLALSLSLDAKKIAVTAYGKEDLGGLGNEKLNDEVNQDFLKRQEEILKLIESNSRGDLFKCYDEVTKICIEVSQKLDAIKSQKYKTDKQTEKNPQLKKYSFVLSEQLATGLSLLRKIDKVQLEMIFKIAALRNSNDCLPDKFTLKVDLESQPNLVLLKPSDIQNKASVIVKVIKCLRNCENDGVPALDETLNSLNIALRFVYSSSPLFKAVYSSIPIKDEDCYSACGLGRNRPLKDMQDTYRRCNLRDKYKCRDLVSSGFDEVQYTFISLFSPMTFGNNLYLRNAGIYSKDSVYGHPDLLAINRENDEIIYTVVFSNSETYHCYVDEEHLVRCIVNAFVVGATRGCLLVLISEVGQIVYSIPREDEIVSKVLALINSYTHESKCLKKRCSEMIDRIEDLRQSIQILKSRLVLLGRYPTLNSTACSFSSEGVQEMVPSQWMEMITTELTDLFNCSSSFLSRQAKELVCVNLTDLSGCTSKVSHTILAATYLPSRSLKLIVRDVIGDVEGFVTSKNENASIINIGVDGESLHILSSPAKGLPGTELSLVKFLYNRLKEFSKENLCLMIARNSKVDIRQMSTRDDEDDDHSEIEDDIDTDGVEDLCVSSENNVDSFATLEDLESYFLLNSCSTDDIRKKRYDECKSQTVHTLRKICLMYVFPLAKKNWIKIFYGQESIEILTGQGTKDYFPCTGFEKTKEGFFKTVTFDAAHLANLLRESAAKGRLNDFGLSCESLKKLSRLKGYEYLGKIISIKNFKLEYDPMNQKSSSICFSEKTEEGLTKIHDFSGAKCCRLIRKAIIESFDTSGIDSIERCKNIWNLKEFVSTKVDPLERIGRPKTSTITNELLQMLYASLDSHIVTFLNLEFFHPRRKSTGTVEQFFGQITMMCDGGVKLNCDKISDILSRVALTNALRLLPNSIKGFSFLGRLNTHMKSYSANVDPSTTSVSRYPRLIVNNTCKICPRNSEFDNFGTRKRKTMSSCKMLNLYVNSLLSEGEVRKHHKKF